MAIEDVTEIVPEVATITPFQKLVLSIGEIPTNYLDSMSYAEQVSWFCMFLQEKVLPVVNQHGEKILEIINYLNNLDLQDEVNNKLDEMAESGQLQEIIAEYLNANALWCFNNVAEMKEAPNLINGSYAKTLGFYNINDGGSSIYKIRTVTNEDTIDEMTIIALSDNSLVAELVLKDEVNTMQLGIENNILTDVSTKLNKLLSLNVNKYIIKKGNYYIDNNLNTISNSYIYFEEGAVINRLTTSSDTYFMIEVRNCNNVTIENAHLIGDKDTHTGSGEWGYGIYLNGSTNINIKDSIIEKTWGDGIYIGYKYTLDNPQPCYHVTIDNCQVLSCSRNGYSICAGKYINLNNCYAYNNKRKDPKSGLDIESEAPEGSDKILDFIEVNNFTSESNTIGISVKIDNDFNNVVINGHNAINDLYGIVFFGLNGKGNIIYENANIIKSRISAITIYKKKTNLLTIRNINIDGRVISDDTHNQYGAITINTTSATDGNLIIDNIKLNNSFSDTYRYQDIITEVGSTGSFSDLTLSNIFTNRYLCLNNVDMSTCDLTNCKFYSNSNGVTINIENHTIYNYIDIKNSLADTTIRNINTNIPNGIYEFILNNNTVPYFIRFIFNSGYTVYGTSSSTSLLNGFRTSNICGYIRFNKQGNKIYVLENTLSNYDPA